MMKEMLSKLGFSEDEIKVYLHILEVGQIPAGLLARTAGIPRSSLYGILRRLTEKGLVAQTQKDGVKIFAAEPPDKIGFLFQQKMEDLEKGQTMFREALPLLQSKQGKKYIQPKFQLFEGKKGVRHVVQDVLLYYNLETLSLWPIKNMLKVLGTDYFSYFNKVRIKNNLSIRAIWPEDQVVSVKENPFLGVGPAFKREIRVAPKGVDLELGYWLYGNRASFISSEREGYGFIIESAEFVGMLATQFEVIWKMSKPIHPTQAEMQPFLDEMKR